jgi:tRNA pseudouridine55 synthase
MSKPHAQNINGILLLDKPLDITSNGILQRIKRLFCGKKAGHTGSLDPLATGMLPICFGEATKFSQFLLESDKYYSVVAKLGVRTTTGDAEGEVLSTQPVIGVTLEKLQQTLQAFLGSIEQVPPMFSAVKYQGQPLYKLARRGIEIERQARTVQIHHLVLESMDDDTFKINVHCSKGTYIRTLVDDIGLALACGAHVIELRRTAVSPYENFKMYTVAELDLLYQQAGLQALHQCLLPLETSVQALPAIYLSTSAAFYLRTGQAVMVMQAPAEGLVRLYSDSGQFMGIGEMLDDGRVSPRRLLGDSHKKLVSV